MRLSIRQGKILFIGIIVLILLIAFGNVLFDFANQSYLTKEESLVLVDSISFKEVSNVIPPMRNTSRRIELTSTSGHQFRIWNTSIDGIDNKDLFFREIRDPKSKALVYSDKKGANLYRKRANSFTTIKQVKIGNLKFIDLDKVNSEEKSITMRGLFIYPILAIIVTLYLRYKLLG